MVAHHGLGQAGDLGLVAAMELFEVSGVLQDAGEVLLHDGVCVCVCVCVYIYVGIGVCGLCVCA